MYVYVYVYVCADHDLTGQIVWPASVLLTWFLRWLG
jgi:hypothetical protein